MHQAFHHENVGVYLFTICLLTTGGYEISHTGPLIQTQLVWWTGNTATRRVTDWSEPASCAAECFGSVSVRLNCGGVGACSPDVSQGVRPCRLIRLIRAGNLAGWQWTLPLMRLSSENSQDGWVLHSPEQLRPARSSSTLTCEWFAPDFGIVSALNQNGRLKRPSRIGHTQTGPEHFLILFFFFSCNIEIILAFSTQLPSIGWNCPKNFKSKQSAYKSGAGHINRHSNRRSYAAPAWISVFESSSLKWFERDVGNEIVALTSLPGDHKRKCGSQWPYCYP